MATPQYYLVGLKGECFIGCGHEKRKQTTNGQQSSPKWIIIFPEHPKRWFDFHLLSHDNYYWFRGVSKEEYEEYDAWEMFPLRSWVDFCHMGAFYDIIHPHARATWEVAPDIPNEQDYYFLDHPEELTSFEDGSKYKVRPLDRPGATKQLREP